MWRESSQSSTITSNIVRFVLPNTESIELINRASTTAVWPSAADIVSPRWGAAIHTTCKRDTDGRILRGRAFFDDGQQQADIFRARESGGDPGWYSALDRSDHSLNLKHFVVQIDGRTRVANIQDGNEGAPLTFSTHADFVGQYANQFVEVKDAKRLQSVGEHWWRHPARRQYSRLVFDPTSPPNSAVYNLWRGFTVRPKAGSWSTVEEFLRNVIVASDKGNLQWLVRWMARGVQYPGEVGEVAVVLRGPKGTGKNTLGAIYGGLFGRHALTISNQKHLVGNFNAHLMDKAVLFVDEAYWAGDKSGEGVLKNIITQPTIFIEGKHINGFEWPNRLKIIIVSNNEWVVPASWDERRFFVLDVSDVHMQDTAYFGRLHASCKAAEQAAFLHHLLHLDLTGFDHRNPPHTSGLNQQKVRSFSTADRWWFGVLADGVFETGDDDQPWDSPRSLDRRVVFGCYREFCKKTQERYPAATNVLARDVLGKVIPGGWICQRATYGTRPWLVKLPSRNDCRQAFAAHHKIPLDQLFPE